MDARQASKLAQAYQWLSEEKEVESRYYYDEQSVSAWFPWNGTVIYDEFRLKPVPAKLLEGWTNRYLEECGKIYGTEEEAKRCAGDAAIRVGVHIREVHEPDIQEMVTRFLNWRLPDDFFPDGGISFKHVTDPQWTHDSWPTGTNLFHAGQAEAMIRHILGDAP